MDFLSPQKHDLSSPLEKYCAWLQNSLIKLYEFIQDFIENSLIFCWNLTNGKYYILKRILMTCYNDILWKT